MRTCKGRNMRNDNNVANDDDFHKKEQAANCSAVATVDPAAESYVSDCTIEYLSQY